MEKSEEEIIPVTDGGYDGQDNIALAKEKNVRLATTALMKQYKSPSRAGETNKCRRR